jgi:hypothetical protein
MKDAEIDAEIDFLEGFDQPTYRGIRVKGSGWLRGHPETGGPVTAGLMPSGSSRAPSIEGR